VTVHGKHQRLIATTGVFAVALVLNAGCTDKKRDVAVPPSPVTSSASPTPSVDPTIADAEQQARAAYTGYIQTWALASQAADPDNPDLPRYIADPLLSLTRHNLRVIKDKGAVQRGAQKATVLSVKVDLSGRPQTATINSCLDYSGMQLVYKSNGSPVPNSAITDPKVPAVVTVAKYPTGQWLVNESKQGSHPC
jgi:hypothetical protein